MLPSSRSPQRVASTARYPSTRARHKRKRMLSRGCWVVSRRTPPPREYVAARTVPDYEVLDAGRVGGGHGGPDRAHDDHAQRGEDEDRQWEISFSWSWAAFS